MSTKILVRHIPNQEDDYAGLKELGEQAARQLGYDELTNQVAQESTIQRLIRIDAAPFTKESVEKYKKKLGNGTFMGIRITSSIIDNITCPGVLLIMGSAFIALVGSMFALLDNASWAIPGWAAASIVLGFMIVGFGIYLEHLRSMRWNLTPLRGYGKPVPEFVLATALAVQNEFKEGKFHIDELVTDVGVNLDPFLVWNYCGDEYYLHVWNEPTFKGKRAEQ